MRFIDSIVEKDNRVLLALEKCKLNGRPVYIWGDGEGADNVEVRAKGYSFAGRLVNKKYYKEKSGVACLEDFLRETDQKINLLVAFKGFTEEMVNPYREKIDILINMDIYAGNCTVDSELMTYSWVLDNVGELERVYDELGDDFSRKVMSAYINQKISSDYKYLKSVKSSPQYFEDIMPLCENEVFVDCGAYDGDSATSFIEALRIRGINSYKKIYSFEPDPLNYIKLSKRGFNNHVCINKGTSEGMGELSFSVLGTSSVFDENGEIKVPINSLDSEIDDDVTIIKMDIEGAELASIKGAKGLIQKYRPKMAVCIYHKKEDLWEIQEYLKELVPEYKFYMRAYDDTATELVLYAIL